MRTKAMAVLGAMLMTLGVVLLTAGTASAHGRDDHCGTYGRVCSPPTTVAPTTAPPTTQCVPSSPTTEAEQTYDAAVTDCYAPPFNPGSPNPCLVPQDAPLCATTTTAAPPTTEPAPTTVAPVPTTVPATTTTAAPPVKVVVTTPPTPGPTVPLATGKALAFTGASIGWPLTVGLLLLVIGVVILRRTRKIRIVV